MRIRKLILKNFGKHELVDFNCDDALVGVLGENASGKSTIFAGIRWLLTGTSDDNLVSYIRNYDPDGPRGQKAEGSMEFEHAGRVFTVEKVISPSGSKARLVEHIKPGEDVERTKSVKTTDEFMADLLKTGRNAAAKVVFIKQGELHRLLENSGAERYKTFARLMDVEYTEQAATRLQKHIEALSKDIPDFTGAVQEAERAVVAAQQEHELAVKGYDADFHSLRKTHNRDLVAGLHDRRLLADKRLTLSQLEVKDAEIERDRESILTLHPDVATYPAAIAALQERRSGLESSAKLRVTMRSRRNDLADLKDTLKTNRVALLKLGAKIDVAGEQDKLSKLRDELVRAEGYEEDLIALEPAERKLREVCIKAGKAGEAKAAAQAVVEANKPLLKDLQTSQAIDEQAVEFLISLDSGVCACPLCGSEQGLEAAERAARLRLLNTRLDKTRAELIRITGAEAEYRKLDQVWRTANTDEGLAAARVRAIKESLAKFTPPERSSGEVKAAIAASEALVKTGIQREIERSKLQGDIRSDEQLAKTYEAELAAYVEADEATEAAQLAEVVGNIDAKNKALLTWRSLDARAKACGGLGQLRAEIAALEDKVGARTEQELQEEIAGSNAELERINGLAEAIKVAAGKLDYAKKRLDELRRQMKQSEEARLKVEHLRRMKLMLGREGATGEYLAYVFRRVLAVTQKYLRMMNSLLEVEPDAADPFELTFRDLANPTTQPLAQSKLSGAQRVRLSLAFLLALHELVVPDLGFLTLDEPSCHMSVETGVSDLRELLERIRPMYSNRGGSVWVCDHQPSLQTVLGRTLRL